MSEDIETKPREEEPAQEETEVTKNSVPIISDKEIEAIFVGGVPVEADESKSPLYSLPPRKFCEIRRNQKREDHQLCEDQETQAICNSDIQPAYSQLNLDARPLDHGQKSGCQRVPLG